MASTQHYVWALGHFVLLFASLYCLFSFVLRRNIAFLWWYKTAFSGGLVSYGIVCYKALGLPQFTGAYLRKAMSDENVQYLTLVLSWWLSKPVTLALAPFAVFSLFHALTFLRTTILPLVFSPTPPATGSSAPPQQSPYAKMIQTWVRANYDSAMRVVAYTELLIMARVLFGALLLKNSFSTALVFAHFLRQRYYHSPFTRDAMRKVTYLIDTHVVPRAPAVIANFWVWTKSLLTRWAGSTLTERT